MTLYSYDELTQALRAVDSIIHKCEKAQEKFPEGNTHHTLLKNRLNAMYISQALITKALAEAPQPAPPCQAASATQLLSGLDLLHTTELGRERMRKNLRLDTEDVVLWCREKILSPHSQITRKGKNWYIAADGCEITVNAQSYTIITAHKRAKPAIERAEPTIECP